MNYFDYQVLKEDEYNLINSHYSQTTNQQSTESDNISNVSTLLAELLSNLTSVPKSLNKNVIEHLNHCLIFVENLIKKFKTKPNSTNSKSFNIFSVLKNLFKLNIFLKNNKQKNLNNLCEKLISNILNDFENLNIYFYKHM